MKYFKPKILPTIILLFVLLIVFFLIYLKFYDEEKQKADYGVKIYETSCGTYKFETITIDSKKISADVADDTCKKDLGLSGRSSMLNNEGMIFLFDKQGNYGFWMKDMLFPLDIIWISEDMRVSGIEEDLQASSYPEIFGKKYLAKYVLEVTAGFAEKNNIKIGDKVIFSDK